MLVFTKIIPSSAQVHKTMLLLKPRKKKAINNKPFLRGTCRVHSRCTQQVHDRLKRAEASSMARFSLEASVFDRIVKSTYRKDTGHLFLELL